MAAPLRRINRRIDPNTQDHVLVRGEREVDETLLTQCYFFLACIEGSSQAFPEWGSRFHIVADKMYEDLDVRVQQESERALQWLLEPGLLQKVETTTTVINELMGVANIDVKVTDQAGRTSVLPLRLG